MEGQERLLWPIWPQVPQTCPFFLSGMTGSGTAGGGDGEVEGGVSVAATLVAGLGHTISFVSSERKSRILS